MRTYPRPRGGLARALRHLGAVVSTLASFSTAHAQKRTYLFEVGAAAAYQGFADTVELTSEFGGLARIGVWLPYGFGVEAEGLITTSVSTAPNSDAASVPVKMASASLLYNLLLTPNSWGYAKFGIGGTKYGGECSGLERGICGTTTMLLAGLGYRLAVSPVVMLRAEGVIQPNSGSTPDKVPVRFSNYGVNFGVSVMLGSKPIPDSDGDGVLNNRDRCAGTPAGAQVDASGCPADSDSDGVANGVDRCANTALGALVDAAGCAQDSDGDNIADGIDKCPETPAGVLVDAAGCPRDSDGDTIADGLDRCSDTPKGATVDALGCPGDEDADGVLDGLDRCPRTPAGANVNAAGCVQGQSSRQPAPVPSDTTARSRAPSGRAAAGMAGAAMVLENVTFGTGSARLQQGAYVELDSIAKVLIANPGLRVEIGGHTDATQSPADDLHLSTLRAEAVRNYLVARGVPFQQVVATGYGSTMPRTADTTPRGRAANRRIELRPLPPGQ